MLQQLIALIIIFYFVARLFWQKKQNKISGNEFIFWLGFWILAGAAIVLIKKVDSLVARLGFSASGIDVLFYMAVVILTYFVFRLRLKIEKQDKNITKIIKNIALTAHKSEKEE